MLYVSPVSPEVIIDGPQDKWGLWEVLFGSDGLLKTTELNI